MILVDANVFMYAGGAEHPLRAPSVLFLERAAAGALDVVTDSEVLQEILHRYRAVNRWSDGRRIYDLARTIVPDVLEIDAATVDVARGLMDQYPELAARDAVHAAVAMQVGAEGIASWDTDFDRIHEVRRLSPGDGAAHHR